MIDSYYHVVESAYGEFHFRLSSCSDDILYPQWEGMFTGEVDKVANKEEIRLTQLAHGAG